MLTREHSHVRKHPAFSFFFFQWSHFHFRAQHPRGAGGRANAAATAEDLDRQDRKVYTKAQVQ